MCVCMLCDKHDIRGGYGDWLRSKHNFGTKLDPLGS